MFSYINPKINLYTRDVTKAYFHADTDLERDVIFYPPKKQLCGKEVVLKVVKPWYGITESCLHWYMNSLTYHEDNLGMTRIRADPSP